MNVAAGTKMRAWVKAAFIALLLCIVAVEIAAADNTPVDPPDRVARLSYSEGNVSIAPAGTEEWAEALLNRPLTSGDKVSLAPDARAELQVGSTLIHLGPESSFSFLELGDDVLQMSLTEGVLALRVRSLGEHETIAIETPNGKVTLLHPGDYTIEVDPDHDEALVKVRGGEAEVLAGDDSHVVRQGEALALHGLEEGHAEVRELAGRSGFEQWANNRDRELQEAQSSRYVASDVIGYEDLDGYGEWVQEREYGYVWRPLYVSVDWAPYRYGRWVWIAPWGYTWVDDARWGFAPFHYGRWAHIRNRWCWVPGPRHVRAVYSPALVAWTGTAGTRVGWFPLGPRDVFVPGYRHSPRYVRRVNECNTRWVDARALRNLGTRRGTSLDYRFAREPAAITVVDRDRFLAGRSLAGARFGIDARDVDTWRGQSRPPALTPYRESVLGGAARSAQFEVRNDNQRPRYRMPNRIPFEAERRAIEANGGQPLSRSQLMDRTHEGAREGARGEGPKQGDDFRGEAWRAMRERQNSTRTLTTAEANTTPRRPQELGTLRSPLPSGERSWRTQRPDTAIDSVARDREMRAREQERGRQSDNTRLRTPPRAWNSGQGEMMRERVQRDRGTMRMPAPVERSQPRRMERAESRARGDGPSAAPAPRTQPQSQPQAQGRSMRALRDR